MVTELTKGRLTASEHRLQQAGILTEENRAMVANHAKPYSLADALHRLQQAGILNQENFAALLAPNHTILLTAEAGEWLWHRIPNHLLTQANFQRLLTAAEHVNPMAELQRVMNQILGFQAQANGLQPVAAFNPAQSTHTASVNASVSASALKLQQNYGSGFDLETKIQEIKAYVNGLDDDSPKHQAAKRCIARITATNYTFTDSSDVSTRQLLAFAYTAIHDETKREGSLDDAKALFVEGLYEIQRGYNLNDQGQDLGGDDSPICSAGTFNKLMEKLNGIHQDVKVCYITLAGATSKFPKLVEAHALSYLESLASPLSAEDYQNVKDLLEQLKTYGSIESIWKDIKPEVTAELWAEFKEAYGNHSSNAQFLSLIENGQYVGAPDLSMIESRLLASSGYQAYLDRQAGLSLGEQRLLLGLEKNSLWANRHSSPKAQENFDKQYGLVLKT